MTTLELQRQISEIVDCYSEDEDITAMAVVICVDGVEYPIDEIRTELDEDGITQVVLNV